MVQDSINEENKLRAIVANARKKRGISLRELSKKTGVGTSTINRLETGKGVPKYDSVLMITKELGLKIEIKEDSA